MDESDELHTSAALQGKEPPGEHWIEGWVGLSSLEEGENGTIVAPAGTDRFERGREEKCICSCRESNSGNPARSLLTIVTGLPRL
jgi:hypothetical protein